MLMNFSYYDRYKSAYEYALGVLEQCYLERDKKRFFRETITSTYKKKRLDPDNKAIRFVNNIKCTADGLLSINRICAMEKDDASIVSTYAKYRKFPIFFFPCEIGGINTSRNSMFGDRIDHTLYDLKRFYADEAIYCRLKNA